MENRINYITSLKDCMSSRNSFAVPLPSDQTQQSFLHDNMEYQVIKQQIKDSYFYNSATKHIKIRLEKWLIYLDKIKTNKIWLKSRNIYIKMLNLMCYCECVLPPFNGLPPEGELPTLSKNQVNRIIDQVQRQLKSSASSRRSSQNIELPKDFTQNEMENILFPTFSQEQRRFQTYYSNSFFQDQSSTLAFKIGQKDKYKPFETDVDQNTKPFKRYKQSQSREYDVHLDDQKKQIQSAFERRYSLSTKRNSKQNVGKQNEIYCDSFSSAKSNLKVGLNQTSKIAPKQTKNSKTKQLKIPLQIKQININLSEEKFKEDTIQKEYWQENSLLSQDNQNQNTPKYITNFTSQNVASDECVQIMSFRQKEGEGCDCTSNMLGNGWLSELFKRINL